MFLLISILLFVVALVLLVPSAVFCLECSAALLVGCAGEKQSQSECRPRIGVLVPAHNEASGIGVTLNTLLPQLTDADRLVVIADNCVDQTAAIARSYDGTTVLEMDDSERKGKGYALDYAIQFIQADPPEVVVIIDADCEVQPGTIECVAKQAVDLGRPVQAIYLMEQPDNPGLKDLLSMLAIKVKNLVRPRGLQQLGMPSLLSGSGMAFPWSTLRKVSLAGNKTVDDMHLSIDLAIAGHPPTFTPAAQVTGRLMQHQAATSQRRRWEHGHLEAILTEVPRLVKESVRQRRFDLLAIALDLFVPPLSLLVILWIAAFSGALVAASWGAAWTPVILLAVAGLLILSAVIAAWAKFGRADLPLLTFLAIPFYILWKIPLYIAFLVKPQTRWIRTERDAVDELP
jgi:cellulose synthase/poly-beta-1,6-N-acetylglucosamine synthase-like glycosyltransferase